MEQRHRQQGALLDAGKLRKILELPAGTQDGPGAEKPAARDLVADVAMGQGGALWLPGGTGRVQDHREIVRHDVGRRQRRLALGDQGREIPGPLISLATPHDDDAAEPESRNRIREAVEALRVGNEYLAARVPQAELQFAPRPPRVERDGHGADRHGGPERDAPFGVVAHRDRDTVALRHPAVPYEMLGQQGNAPEMLGIAQSLVLVHQPDPVGGLQAAEQDLAQ